MKQITQFNPLYLSWITNKNILYSKIGSQYETIPYSHTDSEGLEVSSLALKFIVTDRHFNHGSMRLKCTASIGRMYVMRNEVLIISEEERESQETSRYRVMENLSQGKSVMYLAISDLISLGKRTWQTEDNRTLLSWLIELSFSCLVYPLILVLPFHRLLMLVLPFSTCSLVSWERSREWYWMPSASQVDVSLSSLSPHHF